MHMSQRRSRMHRTRTGKSLALTSRDMEIFRILGRYRFLRSTYLHAFVGGDSEKRFKERLGDLFHEGYLDRPKEQWRFADSRFMPVVHELGYGGRAAIATAGGEPAPITWLQNGPHRQFEHSLMICEVLASIELAIRHRRDLRFIAWSEILAKAPEYTRQSAKPYLLTAGEGISVAPDALFGIEYQRDGRRSYRFFALEADRGTMPLVRANKNQTSYLGKLAAYREIIERGVPKACLRVPNLLVLTVTTNDARIADMVAQSTSCTCGSAAFLFKAVHPGTLSAPATKFVLEPWQRAGQPALVIGRSS